VCVICEDEGLPAPDDTPCPCLDFDLNPTYDL
jgi:hypothetical protein